MALAYLVLFGSLLAFSCYVWLLRNARVSLVATYAYVNPVVAVILGAAFLGEAVTARTFVAGGRATAGGQRPGAALADRSLAAVRLRAHGPWGLWGMIDVLS